MYAIVNISGKQFKAEKGSKLCVPKQSLEEGKKLVIDDVLLVHDGKSTQFGSPKVAGAKVTATIGNIFPKPNQKFCQLDLSMSNAIAF